MKQMKKLNINSKRFISILFASVLVLSACGNDSELPENAVAESDNSESSDSSENSAAGTGDVGDASFPFADGALAQDITTVDCELSDGTTSTCYSVTVIGISATNDIGPFCPPTIESSAEEGGLWVDGDNAYDIDGAFIEGLAQTYDDDNWKLYDDEGNVNITDTQEAFEGAAKPDVEEEYQNHCVEGKIEWTTGGEPVEATVVVPVDPQSTGEVTQLTSAGVTLDGVRIDGPAPVDAILGAYTIAAFDDCGGHVNPNDGYHIHAAAECAEFDGDVEEGETAPYALALDGHMIHFPYATGEEPETELDECNGHESVEYGYHYHANAPEDNQVLSCVTGPVSGDAATNAGGGPGGGGRGGPPGE